MTQSAHNSMLSVQVSKWFQPAPWFTATDRMNYPPWLTVPIHLTSANLPISPFTMAATPAIASKSTGYGTVSLTISPSKSNKISCPLLPARIGHPRRSQAAQIVYNNESFSGDTERLPPLTLVFNTLPITGYSCEEKLKIKLRLAITHHEGFGLI